MHGTCNIPICQSESPDTLLDVHLIGNARPVQTIRQRFCAVCLGQIDPHDSYRVSGTCGKVLFRRKHCLGRGGCRLRNCACGTRFLGLFCSLFLQRREPGARDGVKDRPRSPPVQPWTCRRDGEYRNECVALVNIQLRETDHSGSHRVIGIGLRLERFIKCFLDLERNHIWHLKF